MDCSEDQKQQLGGLKIELLTFLLDLNTKDEFSEAYPDDVWGYVGYSDEYWMGKSEQLDFEKAFKII